MCHVETITYHNQSELVSSLEAEFLFLIMNFTSQMGPTVNKGSYKMFSLFSIMSTKHPIQQPLSNLENNYFLIKSTS